MGLYEKAAKRLLQNFMEEREMKATNIWWSIDFDEVYEKLDEMDNKKAAETLGLLESVYANLNEEERHDYAYDYFRHRRTELEKFLDLPDEVEIPEDITADEDIAEYISGEYGYCIETFSLPTDED